MLPQCCFLEICQFAEESFCNTFVAILQQRFARNEPRMQCLIRRFVFMRPHPLLSLHRCPLSKFWPKFIRFAWAWAFWSSHVLKCSLIELLILIVSYCCCLFRTFPLTLPSLLDVIRMFDVGPQCIQIHWNINVHKCCFTCGVLPKDSVVIMS